MEIQRLPVLIVGASGHLGQLVTKHCLLRPNLLTNILIRNPDKNKVLCDDITKAGGKCFIGDLTTPETIKNCTKSIHTVISCVAGRTVEWDGQIALLNDAVENNVKRFIPSDFAYDFSKIKEDEHPHLGKTIQFRKRLENTNIKPLYVANGLFMETLFAEWPNGLTYWGDIDQKFSLSCYEDTAKYVAAAVAKEDRVGNLKIEGSRLSTREIQDIYNQDRGTKIEAKRLGSVEDMKKKIVELKEAGDEVGSITLGYYVYLYDGRALLDEIHNEEFPEIKAVNFEEFVKVHPEIKFTSE